ncbi:nitrogenase-stabilizing/protective protein NifW [Betaproteobacteria bacterium]|nr:nitrogenase-stabilizing/protective protein NifW [Betaproteobacteria bacterium]GHT90238.1 nitrogenase-stabilizing/protective protein NifW [Betaproteobacteria bacterium]GHU09524.1 nitrogenase-stabilizing/protective protein NifW [Betaproteobacteria bacterium]GHU13087.1 nitrogenase-stabilizing/protective protein NifW [Betaproteobacteria bacterium]GHU16381.1 nitrogenase-stabilizing/protective protein NifW [Betaproteobacteria bacterium]
MNTDLTLDEALRELVSAEDFLDYFEVPYAATVVHVNRLHILQRFHDYLHRHAKDMPTDDAERRAIYQKWLAQAYEDFTKSDALTEKVFAVFQNVPTPEGGMSTFVSLDKVFQ